MNSDEQAQSDYEDMKESDDQQIQSDFHSKDKFYPSDMTPQDFYQWKRLIVVPEASEDFKSKIDKDVTLANLSGAKPSLAELDFLLTTIELFESMFVIEKFFYVNKNTRQAKEFLNQNDKPEDFVEMSTIVFDECFRPTLNALKGSYKFNLTGSRAMGDDRAAKLDVQTSIEKKFMKKNKMDKNVFGGGN